MICVLATMEAVAGRRNDLVALIQAVAPKVRAEQGCIEYVAMIDAPSGLAAQAPVRDNAIVLVEKWESVAALQAHLKTPHMAEFARQAKDLRLGMSLQVLEPA